MKMEPKKEVTSDQRFSRITRDPRFWEMPEKDRKIKIDKRFQAMFHDKKFKLKYTVDKRGRPVNHSSTEDLKRFYDISDSDSDLSDSDQNKTEKKVKVEKSKSKDKKDSDKFPDGSKKSKVADHKSLLVSQPDTLKNKQQKCKTMKKTNVTESARGKQDSSVKDVCKYDLENKGSENEGSLDLEDLEGSGKTDDEGDSEENGEESDLGDEGIRTESGGGDGDDDDDEEEEEEEEEEESGEESEIDDDESDSGPDLARGKGNIETSSEDEEENDLAEVFPKEPEVIHGWGELAKDAPHANMITRRLAVCNMDWDRLKAKDLLALFNSFTPKGGVVFSVKIYPSEFGKQRMKEEVVNGPTELLSLPEDVTENDSIYKEKLRDYQFKRLKYYYAVVECDSPETANKIYEECDGLEFESSCSFVDLRFVPDEMIFDDEPKDLACEVDGAAYKPKYFTSAAVATSKVDITWDETDHERVTSLSRTFKKDELLDMDFQAYLASSSEEEEEEKQQGSDATHTTDIEKPKLHPKDDEEQIAKYRELLRSIQEKEKHHQETDMEMEIKWVPGLKESAEEMVRNKLEGKDKLTPWEQFLEKKKEKRKLKKKQKATAEETQTEDECPSDVDWNDPYFAEELGPAGTKKKLKKKGDTQEKQEDTEKHKQAEMALLVMEEEEDERQHFNYDKIVEQQNLSKKKKKLLMKKKELLTDDFQVNVADARFQAIYTSHLFNLDPSDPNFKKTKAVEKILEEKARRRQQGLADTAGKVDDAAEKKPASKKSMDPSLSMLIKSVKNKTEQFQARKKQKVR
uniref:ESF1 homolog n=1 Tax=Pogona vitticeps TaxID=103695 RepID=A0A6J0UA32_9SAUR